ncbi:MAG TPA: NUDIX domain-containing protein [Candidatus Paceibacterota bacterium]
MSATLQVGVKAFLKNPEGKILILERNASKYGKTVGPWDIAGGRINPGESLMENLEREVQEETGLRITSELRLIAAQDIMPDDMLHVVRLTYAAHTEGVVRLSAEHVSHRWVTFPELMEIEDLDVYAKELVTNHVLTEDSWR